MPNDTTKPNILFIMSDEHDPAVTQCYGDKIVNTPNLDRLAQGGVLFDNCYTTSPLCVPARLSFTAGKYISRCNGWNNSCKLESDEIPSLPRILNDAGYETFLCGKQHYDKHRRYGFQHDLIPEHNNSTKTNWGSRRAPNSTRSNRGSWKGRTSQFHVGNQSMIMKKDTLRTEKAIEFLQNRKADDNPFFFFLGYISPHFPLIVPDEIYQKYKDKVPMPEIPDGLIEGLPRNYHQLRLGFGMDNQDPEIVKNGRELYWALVEWMDIEIGKVLTALENSEVANNTIVVYTSDHGENKGDHGLWWKNNCYEHAARIPLIVNYPQMWKGDQIRDKACSMVDIVQTLSELAGASSPADWDGDSLVPYLNDPDYEWKDFALCEYYGHNIASGMTCVRKGDYKYIYHNRISDKYPAERELFNITEDPKEFRNLANMAEFGPVVEEYHARMVEELGREPDEIEQYYYQQTGLKKPRIAKWLSALGQILKKT